MSNHTCNGPFSDKKPSKELQPGPPFNQSTTGSLAGSFCDSTNLKRICQHSNALTMITNPLLQNN